MSIRRLAGEEGAEFVPNATTCSQLKLTDLGVLGHPEIGRAAL
jgi:hypothetical protein